MRKFSKLFICSGILYIIGVSLGILMGLSVKQTSTDIVNQPNILPSIYFAIELMKHNGMVAIIVMLGIFTFAVPTVILLVSNGFSLGYIIARNYVRGVSVVQICLRILPHGTTEIIAFIVAGVIGLQGVTFYFSKFKKIKFNLKLVAVVSFLVVISALIEGIVTPILINS